MSGQVRVYARPSGAFGNGHVGLAFLMADGKWTSASVENPNGGPITSPGETGLWSEISGEADVGGKFKKRDYTKYKALTVQTPNWHAARQMLAEWHQQPYELVGKNCMDAAFAVLTAYGAKLPTPSSHPKPNDWFKQVQSTEKPV